MLPLQAYTKCARKEHIPNKLYSILKEANSTIDERDVIEANHIYFVLHFYNFFQVCLNGQCISLASFG